MLPKTTNSEAALTNRICIEEMLFVWSLPKRVSTAELFRNKFATTENDSEKLACRYWDLGQIVGLLRKQQGAQCSCRFHGNNFGWCMQVQIWLMGLPNHNNHKQHL